MYIMYFQSISKTTELYLLYNMCVVKLSVQQKLGAQSTFSSLHVQSYKDIATVCTVYSCSQYGVCTIVYSKTVDRSLLLLRNCTVIKEEGGVLRKRDTPTAHFTCFYISL